MFLTDSLCYNSIRFILYLVLGKITEKPIIEKQLARTTHDNFFIRNLYLIFDDTDFAMFRCEI